MVNEYRWQVPGNGNPFDSKLKDWHHHKMSKRSIGVLEYISEKENVKSDDFKNEIKEYLFDKYNQEQNKSEAKHFYRPLEFIGMIRNNNEILSLSIDGKNFLNCIHSEDYDHAIDFYIIQSLKASYPNTATKHIKLGLFPFRIIFKLLLDYEKIPKNWFNLKIPYITNINDLKNIDLLNSKKEKYTKWTTWVLSYLIKWNVIIEKNESIILTDYKKELIKTFLKDLSYENMFFATDNEYCKIKNIQKTTKRNSKLSKSFIEKQDFKCFFDENHSTFPTNSKPNYVEAHHIIPISLNDSFSEELDCEENLIALCPNCHKSIHLAKNEYKEKLLEKILSKNPEFKKFGLTITDMKEIYFTKTTETN